MILEEEFDADEILRDPDDDGYVESKGKDDEVVGELDFEGSGSNTYDELASDLDQAADLWE